MLFHETLNIYDSSEIVYILKTFKWSSYLPVILNNILNN